MRKIIVALYGILFAVTPLIMYPQTSELFEFNKLIVIYSIAAAVLLYWAIDCFQSKSLRFPKTVLLIPFFIFLLSQILSTVFSIDPHTSLYGYYGRFNGGLLSIIAYGILWIGFVLYINKKHLIKFIALAVFISVLVMAWGIPGHFGHDTSCLLFTGQWNNTCWTDQFRPAERMFSTLGQPNWLGAYSAITVFFGWYLLLIRKVKKKMIWDVALIAYLFLAYSCILFTRSRSAEIAVAIGTIVLAGGVIIVRAHLSVRLFVIGLCAAGLSVYLWQTGVPQVDHYLEKASVLRYFHTNQPMPASQSAATIQPVKQSVTSSPSAPPVVNDVTDSLDIRKIVWKGAWELAAQYPVFGTGVETFAYAYYFTRPIEHNLTSEWDYLYNKAHNEYLNYLATTGYVGLGTYLLMIGYVLYLFVVSIIKQVRTRDEENWVHRYILYICLALAYGMILITNYVGFSTSVISLFFFLIPAMVVIDTDRVQSIYIRRKKLAWTVSGVVVLLSLWTLVQIGSYWYADTLYAKAELYSRVQEYQYSIRLYQQALSLHYEHVYEDKLSFALSNVAVLFASEKQQQEADALMKLATYYNNDSLAHSPKNVLYWKTRSKNFYLYYQIDNKDSHLTDAIAALKEAYILSPTDPKIPYSLSLFYALLADDQKIGDAKIALEKQSIDAIDASITLKSDYRDAYMLKGQLQKKFGDSKGAQNTFEYVLEVFGSSPDVLQELGK